MSNDKIHLVLTDKWFEEIKSGRKTHEYRECKWYWIKKIVMGVTDRKDIYDWATGNSNFENLPRDLNEFPFGFMYGFTKVEFQKAYRKNAEKMLFNVRNVTIINGKDTDLKIDKWVFDIELGDRIDE